MTTERPLVMAKRLVFVEDRTCDVAWLCSTAFGTYEVRAGLSGWKWFLHPDGNRMLYIATGKTDSSEACEAACQRDFDARWLSITEVPELVWHELDVIQQLTKNGYSLTRYDDDDWRWSFGMTSGSERSEDAAKRAMNTHNRRLVLGTTETTT